MILEIALSVLSSNQNPIYFVFFRHFWPAVHVKVVKILLLEILTKGTLRDVMKGFVNDPQAPPSF